MPDPPAQSPSPWETRRARQFRRRLFFFRLWSLVWRTLGIVVVWFLAAVGVIHLLGLDRSDWHRMIFGK